MKEIILTFFLSVLIIGVKAQNITDKIQEAKNAHYTGNYLLADSLFQLVNQSVAKEDLLITNWIAYSQLLIDWEALEQADSILQIALKTISPIDTVNLISIELFTQKGQLLIAQKKYQQAIELFQRLLTKSEYLPALSQGIIYYHLGEIYLENDALNQAEENLALAEAIIEKKEQLNYNDLAIIWNHKGRLWSKQSKFEKAATAYQQVFKLNENKPLKFNNLLWTNYNQAILEIELGHYAKAEILFLALKPTFQKLYPNRNGYYKLLGKLGVIAEETGYYKKAILLYREAIHFFEQSNNISDFIFYANNLAILLEEELDKQIEVERIYLKAKSILAKNGDKQSMTYAGIVNNLAEFYEENNQLNKADTLYQEAKIILKKIVGKYDYSYASVIYNLAFLQKKLGKLDLAEQYFLEVMEIDKATIGEHHPDYIDYTLLHLADFYDFKNDLPKASHFYRQANQGKLDLINYYYSIFDEQTRLNFLKEAEENFDQYFSFLHRRRKQAISFSAAQTINLQIKGLALDYFQTNKSRALTTTDTLLQKFYGDFQKERKLLSQLYALSKEEQKLSNVNLVQQKEKVNRLEKQLVRRADELNQNIKVDSVATFTTLNQQLLGNEISIDFIDFQYYNLEEKTDTTHYYALLTTKESPTPKFIPLCTQKQLKTILKLSNQYGAGYTKYPEIGKKLYELIWQPLEPYLKDIKTIHLSPTGLLHKIAFGGLPYQDGHLLDQYQINYYGNLRDFINAQPAAIPKSIALAGGAYFDIDSTDLVKLAQEAEEFAFVKLDSIALSTSIASVSRAIANDSTRNAIEFNYLPGTKKEVEQLEIAFKKEGWQTVTYTGAQASEDNVKILNGENAPGILHLATHGYFFNPYEKQEGTTLSDETMRERIIGAESPLLRSGLVFSGVNHSWKGGKAIAGLEDGVLTAFEIANMELWNTELVVLSACETGLGDVESTEGVFGLQRAFKAAGVNKLVISLWKIPDAQTAELMQLFYQNFLSGMPLAKALRRAKLTMSKQYSPFYWAGFVLVE